MQQATQAEPDTPPPSAIAPIYVVLASRMLVDGEIFCLGLDGKPPVLPGRSLIMNR
jgi:hypothetical protein